MGVACNISHGCRPLGSQQKGQKTNACEPKHLVVVVVVVVRTGVYNTHVCPYVLTRVQTK